MTASDYRKDFPLLQNEDTIYIDNAATAQRPQAVLDAVKVFYETENANPLRGFYPLSLKATESCENARATVRDFIHATSKKEIIFTRNTTEGLNLVAYSYGLSHLKAGDEIAVTIMEHHSNLLPWQMVARQTGAELKFMECETDGTLTDDKTGGSGSGIQCSRMCQSDRENRGPRTRSRRSGCNGWCTECTAYACGCAETGCGFYGIFRA